MRIGMNLIPLRPGQMGGAEMYFRDFLAELLKRGEPRVRAGHRRRQPRHPARRFAECRRILFAREAACAGAPLNGVARMLRGGMAGLREGYQRLVPDGARGCVRPLLRSGARARSHDVPRSRPAAEPAPAPALGRAARADPATSGSTSGSVPSPIAIRATVPCRA